MSGAVHRDLARRMRNYLSRQRMAGRSAVYRLEVAAVRSLPEGEACPDPGPAGAAISSAGREGPAASLLQPPEKTTGEGESGGDKLSIRYRHGAAGATQGSLFSEGGGAEEPVLDDLDIESLARQVSECRRCPLWEGRTNTVFGSGSVDAGVVFIGEAPGKEEDIQGLPFVGRAGKLLTKMLASVGMSREEVYITNILKCRPPGNRDPNEEEARACEAYLRRQLELINPDLICALGRVAGQKLLKRNASLSMLRQGIHYYEDIRVLVTYHPAALLRNPNLKRDSWEDLKRMRRICGEALEEK